MAEQPTDPLLSGGAGTGGLTLDLSNKQPASPWDQWLIVTDAQGNPISYLDPKTQQTITIPKGSASASSLVRMDAQGRPIAAGDTTTPAVSVYNPVSGTNEAIPGATRTAPGNITSGAAPVYVYDPSANGGRGGMVNSGVPTDETAIQAARADVYSKLKAAGVADENMAVTIAKAPAEIQKLLVDSGMDQATAQKTLSDIEIARTKTPYENAVSQATAQNQLASATGTMTNAQVALGKMPSDVFLTTSQGQAQLANALSIAQKSNQPTLLQSDTTSPTQQWVMPNGSVVTSRNSAFQPKDVGQMQANLNAQVNDKQAELQQAVSANKLSQQDATTQFNDWYQSQAAPQQGQIQQAQIAQTQALQQAQATLQSTQSSTANNQLTTAGTVGNNLADIALRTMPYRVGPGAADTLNQISQNIANSAKGVAPKAVDMSSLVTQGPDPTQMYMQGLDRALAHLSPTAAGNLAQQGFPPYGYPQQAPQPQFNPAQAGGAAAAGGGAAPAAAPAPPASLPSGQGLNQVGMQGGQGEPGIWNTGMVFQNGRMVPAANANAQGGPVAQGGPGTGQPITAQPAIQPGQPVPASAGLPAGSVVTSMHPNQVALGASSGGPALPSANNPWNQVFNPQLGSVGGLPNAPQININPMQPFTPNMNLPSAPSLNLANNAFNNNPYVFPTATPGNPQTSLQQTGVSSTGAPTQAVGQMNNVGPAYPLNLLGIGQNGQSLYPGGGVAGGYPGISYGGLPTGGIPNYNPYGSIFGPNPYT